MNKKVSISDLRRIIGELVNEQRCSSTKRESVEAPKKKTSVKKRPKKGKKQPKSVVKVTESTLRKVILEEFLREAMSIDPEVAHDVEKAFLNVISDQGYQDRIARMINAAREEEGKEELKDMDDMVDAVVDMISRRIMSNKPG